MGGRNFGQGSADIDPRVFQDPIEDRSGYALELRGPVSLVLCSPFVVELKLTSTDTRGKVANTHLHPNLGYVQLGIMRPGGKTTRYRPFLQHCADPRLEMLDSARPAVYDSAYIGYGQDGFYFDQPGRYQIRGIYHAPDGSKVYSNVLTTWVRSPINAEEEQIAELHLGDDQGKLLYLLGSDSDTLRSGNDALLGVLDQYPRHPMAVYANMVMGINAARTFKVASGDGSLKLRKRTTRPARSTCRRSWQARPPSIPRPMSAYDSPPQSASTMSRSAWCTRSWRKCERHEAMRIVLVRLWARWPQCSRRGRCPGTSVRGSKEGVLNKIASVTGEADAQGSPQAEAVGMLGAGEKVSKVSDMSSAETRWVARLRATPGVSIDDLLETPRGLDVWQRGR